MNKIPSLKKQSKSLSTLN